ncbi:MAG: DUF3089 domain-containing protein [Myxococcota bacterium]
MTQRRLMLLVAVILLPLWGCRSVGTWISTPGQPFKEVQPPKPPDYAKESSWAALPQKESAAQSIPPGVEPGNTDLTHSVDVFFLHPTTYFWRWHWNAPIGGWMTRVITSVTLAGSASPFNGAGRIYAPRYRQLTLSGFDIPKSRTGGLDVAYQDVRSAFMYFLAEYNEGRPMLLVGHSQGSRLILRLLREFFDQGDLRERLIAAYPVGTWVHTDPETRTAYGLPICEDAEQTGCVISWRVFAWGSESAFVLPPLQKPGIDLCVNPLTWKANSEPAPASDNLGSIPLPMFGQHRPEPGLIGAQCEKGVLYIDRPKGWRYGLAEDDGSYHAYDIELFYVNARMNAIERARAWLANHGKVIPEQVEESPQGKSANE